MAALQIAISQDFFTAFANIPRAQQKKVNEFVSKFRANPQASGINYEKINDAANAGYRSVRIDQDYRGIVMKPDVGNVYILLWVDKHDDAYDWARRHKIQVNPETGSLQLYEVLHSESEEVPSGEDVVTSETATPLIAARDRELLRLGVPDDWLEQVKSLTSQAQLDALESKLPVEAFEALCFLAEGLPLDEVLAEYAQPDGVTAVDTTDFDAALARTQSQRRFRVIEDDFELQQMLDALESVAGPRVRARVKAQRDERIAGIVANWPRGVVTPRAHALGLRAESSFEDIIRRYIDDCRRDNPQALKGMDA